MGAEANDDAAAILVRIAEALERLAPPPATPSAFEGARLFRHDPGSGGFLPAPDFALALDLLVGIERQKGLLVENLRRFANGLPANH
ncbi:MAG: ATP-binding protein, partial [Caulobacteraceae bacterium]